MPNIFDGLNQFDDNVIRENIAMLEAINMENVIKGYGTTVVNKGAKLINGIGGIIGKNLDINVKKEKRVDDYIEEKKYQIRNLNREELNTRLKNILKERNNCTSNTEDAISTYVINSVAKHMKLGENMTTAQKADGIHRRYFEKMLNSMQENLKKQNQTEANNTINEIEKSIKNLSEQDKEELKKILSLDELTGKEIRSVLMKAGTPALIMGTLTFSGFGAFMALTTVMHAVFTTILGITLPFAVYTGATSTLSILLGPAGIALIAGTAVWQITKGNKTIKNEIMGQIIFTTVNAMGGSFVAKNEDLPSYEENQEILDKIRIMDEEYNKLVESNKELEIKINILESKWKKSQETIKFYQNQIDNEKNRSDYSKNKIIKLNSEKDTAIRDLKKVQEKLKKLNEKMSNKKDEDINLELERINNLCNIYESQLVELNKEIIDQNNIIEEASKEIDEKTKTIQEIEKNNKELMELNKSYKSEIQTKNDKIKKTEEKRKKDLAEKWDRYFNKFEIKTSAIRDVVKFNNREIIEIERALIELHSLNDYRSASRGKMIEDGKEYDHMGLSLPCGFPTRILYIVTNNSNKKVIIERIYKHNEKVFQ